MATRIVKLYGKAYSVEGEVSLTINYNGSEVFSGPVVTESAQAAPDQEASDDELVVIASWNTDTETVGDIPLTITPTGGDFIFGKILMNYTGTDGADGNAAEFFDLPTDQVLGESDEKFNVTLNGTAVNPDFSNPNEGIWHYKIDASQVFGCNIRVSADKVVMSYVNNP